MGAPSQLKMTPGVKEIVIEVLRDIPVLKVAAEVAGVKTATIRRHRENDEEFDQAVADALEDGYDTLEQEAVRRARDGWDEPVYYKGEEVGQVKRFSDALMNTLLRGYRSKTFAQQHADVTSGGKSVSMQFNLGGKPPAEEAADDSG